jgi:hypothetical protein
VALPQRRAGLAGRRPAKADQLDDLLRRETFFRELPAIEQLTLALDAEYDRRFDDALDARVAAYDEVLARLRRTEGWEKLAPDAQQRIAAPLARGQMRDSDGVSVVQLRSERDAAEPRLRAAMSEVYRLLEGERVVAVSLDSYFGGGASTARPN